MVDAALSVGHELHREVEAAVRGRGLLVEHAVAEAGHEFQEEVDELHRDVDQQDWDGACSSRHPYDRQRSYRSYELFYQLCYGIQDRDRYQTLETCGC